MFIRTSYTGKIFGDPIRKSRIKVPKEVCPINSAIASKALPLDGGGFGWG
jgi:hypothetical protein